MLAVQGKNNVKKARAFVVYNKNGIFLAADNAFVCK